MATIDINIPQMGEGLTEVRLLQFLKQAGDSVSRDEILYTMETDKATLEVESPEAGTLVEWLAEEGAILPIGSPVARIQTTAGEVTCVTDQTQKDPQEVGRESQLTVQDRVIPPRTRAYARQLGLSDADLSAIEAPSGKLMPADLDAYVAKKKHSPDSSTTPVPISSPVFTDRPLPARQRALVYHMKRSAQVVIPGTIMRPIAWAPIRQAAAEMRARSPQSHPTEFQLFAYSIAQATQDHPKFRSTLLNDETVREYEHLNLGIAVALPGGELTTAVVARADSLGLEEFIPAIQDRIQMARNGIEQADSSVQVVLSYLGAHGIRSAIPVLVSPAVGTLFIGEAYDQEGVLLTNISLTFDHRLVNGVEAAEMLNSVASQIAKLTETVSPSA